ncbi:hypothetical protein HDU97_003906 [Phlyctochytrium planicorne]|nr:hypothetical protein HDU97_003906 [Phlyctochytrium planicorne]
MTNSPLVLVALALLVPCQLVIAQFAPLQTAPCTGIKKALYKSGGRYLAIEVFADSLAHFEVSEQRSPPNGDIFVTPMVDAVNLKQRFCGPSAYSDDGKGLIETPALRLNINLGSLNVDVYDKIKNTKLTTYSYEYLQTGRPNDQGVPSYPRLHWTKEQTQAVYGIAQAPAYDAPFYGSADGNFLGRQFNPPSPYGKGNAEGYGNSMQNVGKGAMAYTSFPIAYMTTKDGSYNHAFFLDCTFKHEWDFGSKNPNDLSVTAVGARALRWFAFSGGSLNDLRRTYMGIVGTMVVPSRSWFGYHQGLFGYKNWGHVNWEADSLVKANIPVESMFMDIYWFGGNFYPRGTDYNVVANSRFGSLAWDTNNFPDVWNNIKNLRKKGPGITFIEEPYLAQEGPTRKFLAASGALATNGFNGPSTVIDYNPWWGVGGLLDFTSPNASLLWSDCKRCKLFSDCKTSTPCPSNLEQTQALEDVIGIWSDLGEPEMFVESSHYYGFPEDDGFWHTTQRAVHNVFQLLGTKSIYDMFHRNNMKRRPTNFVRTGAPGIQRYGGLMWSGDIGSSEASLSTHMGVKKHVIMAGVDMHSSDVGGFHREDCQGCDLGKLYTIWMANSAWFDMPIKPHTWQTDPSVTASAGIMGNVGSNAFNIQMRYFLIPLYYSLAHIAHRTGDTIVTPMFLRFPNDATAHGMGHQYMIGPILAAHHTNPDTSRQVYFPANTKWYHFHTHQYVQGTGAFSAQNFPAKPFGDNGAVTLPAFVHEGSVFPVSPVSVDASIRNVFQMDPTNSLFRIRVYPGPANQYSTFTVYEDDGESRLSTIRDEFATTQISQATALNGNNRIATNVTVSAMQFGAGFANGQSLFPASRTLIVECIIPNGANSISSITVDGRSINQWANNVASNPEGWGYSGLNNRIVNIRAAPGDINGGRNVVVEFK